MKQNARKNLQNRKRRRQRLTLKSRILRQNLGVRIEPFTNQTLINDYCKDYAEYLT